MTSDFNAELHARPSIYFTGLAFVEHIALMPSAPPRLTWQPCYLPDGDNNDDPRTQVEHHTEFVTITRVTQLSAEADAWPVSSLSVDDIAALVEMDAPRLISRVGYPRARPRTSGTRINPFKARISRYRCVVDRRRGGAGVFDFRVQDDQTSRILLSTRIECRTASVEWFWRIYEIETYRSMALLGLPEARRLAPLLGDYDKKLVQLTNRNQTTPTTEHKKLLDEISGLSAQIISAAAGNTQSFSVQRRPHAKSSRNASASYAESSCSGLSAVWSFVARRFRPAVRTCEAHRVAL